MGTQIWLLNRCDLSPRYGGYKVQKWQSFLSTSLCQIAKSSYSPLGESRKFSMRQATRSWWWTLHGRPTAEGECSRKSSLKIGGCGNWKQVTLQPSSSAPPYQCCQLDSELKKKKKNILGHLINFELKKEVPGRPPEEGIGWRRDFCLCEDVKDKSYRWRSRLLPLGPLHR